MGASVERCVHNRRDGVWGHAHRGGKWAQASGDACTIDATAWCMVETRTSGRQVGTSREMCELATRERGARDMAWGVGGDGRVPGGGWVEPRGAERGRCRWVRGCEPRGCGAERCGARAVRVA